MWNNGIKRVQMYWWEVHNVDAGSVWTEKAELLFLCAFCD